MAIANSGDSKAEAIAALFRTAKYQELESAIADALGKPIVSDVETMVPFAVEELAQSGLELGDLERLLDQKAPLTIQFGVELNRGEVPFESEEEWNYDEGNQQPAQQNRMEEGLGIGFAMTYLVYVEMLQRSDDVELLRYLRARRIPHAARFAKRLRSYFARACAA